MAALIAFGDLLAYNYDSTLGAVMTAVPPIEESTKAILAIFKAMGFSSGAILQRDQVEMQFKVNGGNADDFSPALKQGVDRGWFGLPSTITIELTPAGFAECKKA